MQARLDLAFNAFDFFELWHTMGSGATTREQTIVGRQHRPD